MEEKGPCEKGKVPFPSVKKGQAVGRKTTEIQEKFIFISLASRK